MQAPLLLQTQIINTLQHAAVRTLLLQTQIINTLQHMAVRTLLLQTQIINTLQHATVRTAGTKHTRGYLVGHCGYKVKISVYPPNSYLSVLLPCTCDAAQLHMM